MINKIKEMSDKTINESMDEFETDLNIDDWTDFDLSNKITESEQSEILPNIGLPND